MFGLPEFGILTYQSVKLKLANLCKSLICKVIKIGTDSKILNIINMLR